MGAVLETGDTYYQDYFSEQLYEPPFDSIVILFSFRYNTLSLPFSPNAPDVIDFSPLL